MMDFLAERSHLARIATVRADGSPSVVPVWFIFEGGKVLITPRKHSAFLQNLRREPRVAITIDEEAGRYRKVLFEGTAEILFEPGDDHKWDDVYLWLLKIPNAPKSLEFLDSPTQYRRHVHARAIDRFSACMPIP
jgi:PPOX class probable F420-dependent enzyme